MLEHTEEGSSSGKQPASCNAREARSKGTRESLPLHLWSRQECMQTERAPLLSRGPLRKGPQNQDCTSATLSSLGQEAPDTCPLPHRSQSRSSFQSQQAARPAGPSMLASGRAMAPPVGRGMHVPLETVLISKAQGTSQRPV